jgi:radical SAM family uncharacterized protein/radical SAM-linked protein
LINLDFIINKQHYKDFIFNELLPFVNKPGQYIGNEINIVRKDLGDVDVRFALVFPDVYEVGMSYMGYPILYNILNKQHGVYAERAFAPWVDMEALLREKKAPLFSLETFSPLTDFDVIGFTFQYELHFSTMLNLIDLAGLPIESKDRDGFPLVIGGGPSAFNPEPVADFFDAIILGDGEEVVVEMAEAIRQAKGNGFSRRDTLLELAKIKGVYVPQFYQAHYTASGQFEALEPIVEGVAKRIRTRTVSDLPISNYPEKPLVPMIQTTHDRISLEIARGCSRGCRFCNAGMIYRPVRQRTPEELIEQAKANIAATGYQEISLVSLSTSDYTKLGDLMGQLRTTFAEDKVSISFPSLRPESFTPEVAAFAKGVRKSGLTLAPEAGSQRLRDVINKATTAPALLSAVDLAFSEGWNLVKLYFMIGHPTETDEDLQGLVDLIYEVRQVAFKYKGKRINVSVSPYIPKVITPFQWVRQDSMEETTRKLDFLKERIRGKNVKLSWRDGDVAQIEGLLARGDRRVGKIVKRAWELGANLEGWSEFFNADYYDQAVNESELTYDHVLAGFDIDAPLPWDHIDKGVTKKFLRDEYQRALGEEQVPDCRFDECHSCGLMGQKVCKELITVQKEGGELEMPIEYQELELPEIFEPEKDEAAEAAVERIFKHARIHYRRGDEVRFLSHLDLLRMFERAIRRSRIPIAFTEGFNPHPKLSFGPSLATGLTSDAEYVDVQFIPNGRELDLAAMLAPQLPKGVDILKVKYSDKKSPSLASIANRADFEIRLNGQTNQKEIEDRIKTILSQHELTLERTKKRQTRTIDVRPYIDSLEATDWGVFARTRMENGKSIRANEILSLLFPQNEFLQHAARIHRAALWVQLEDKLIAPMDLSDAEAGHAKA